MGGIWPEILPCLLHRVIKRNTDQPTKWGESQFPHSLTSGHPRAHNTHLAILAWSWVAAAFCVQSWLPRVMVWPSVGGISACMTISLSGTISPCLCLFQSRSQKRDKSRLSQEIWESIFLYRIENTSYTFLILQICVCAKTTDLSYLLTCSLPGVCGCWVCDPA